MPGSQDEYGGGRAVSRYGNSRHRRRWRNGGHGAHLLEAGHGAQGLHQGGRIRGEAVDAETSALGLHALEVGGVGQGRMSAVTSRSMSICSARYAAHGVEPLYRTRELVALRHDRGYLAAGFRRRLWRRWARTQLQRWRDGHGGPINGALAMSAQAARRCCTGGAQPGPLSQPLRTMG